MKQEIVNITNLNALLIVSKEKKRSMFDVESSFGIE